MKIAIECTHADHYPAYEVQITVTLGSGEVLKRNASIEYYHLVPNQVSEIVSDIVLDMLTSSQEGLWNLKLI